MNQKAISVILIILAFGFFAFKIFGIGRRSDIGDVKNFQTAPAVPAQNVTMVNGKQVVEITARGGYSPRKTTAKAGVPTTLRMNTNGSYDCSVALRIPKLNIAKNLEPTAVTEIDIGTPVAGVMRGICGMGMYSFEINFQS